jgi:hypothetical protein
MNDEKPKSLEERKVNALEDIGETMHEINGTLDLLLTLLEKLTRGVNGAHDENLVIQTLDIGRE